MRKTSLVNAQFHAQKTTKRAALYARVSTEDQAREGYSIAAQLSALRKYCEARSWQISKEYVDAGHSGRNDKRPAYQQMLKEKDTWDTILVLKMDRIHRNQKNFIHMMDLLAKSEKEFNSVSESIDTSSAMGRFLMSFMQQLAQLESELIGERVFMGMNQKAQTDPGGLGRNTPYGYTYLNGKFRPEVDEAKIVRRIFAEFYEGWSLRKIARALNTDKIRTKQGKTWHAATIAGILRNTLYVGDIRWGEIQRRGEHIQIIDLRTNAKVQRRLQRLQYRH